MKTITIDDIRDWNPCYDLLRYIPEDWSGTAIDILRIKKCPAKDRLWVVLREECINAKELRLFAVRCAREAMRLTGWDDPRSVTACDVAERYARGKATKTELEVACDAVRNAAWTAAATARAAVRNTAYAAAATACAAAWSAAWSAAATARAAAWSAAREAAYAAARNAARAADAAWTAAYAAAWVAARDQQVEWLIEMLEGDDDE